MKKLEHMNVKEREKYLEYMRSQVIQMRNQYAAIARNPCVSITPICEAELNRGGTMFQTPRNEVVLTNNISLQMLAAESTQLMEELTEFLKTVKDNNSETIQTVRQSFLSVLREET